MTKTCANSPCDRPATGGRCSRCHNASYCSAACQKEAWATHKATCKSPDAGLKKQRETLESMNIPGSGGQKKDPPEVEEMLARMTAGMKFGAGVSVPATWAKGLSSSQQREWLVDVYRMRVDDDYGWGGGNMHGLYDPDHTPETLLLDFLVFVKLAVNGGVIPEGWDFSAFLKVAGGLLKYSFDKEDAHEKWGGENYFNVMMGGRSLRATRESVYKSPVNVEKDSNVFLNMRKLVGKSVKKLFEERPEFLADVGGVNAWKALLEKLKVELRNPARVALR